MYQFFKYTATSVTLADVEEVIDGTSTEKQTRHY